MITSSQISSAPYFDVTARNPFRKPSDGGTRPMFPATGSTITAAISSPRFAKARSTAARSLYGATSVSATAPRVTPADDDAPIVSTPEPLLTSIASEWPW